MRRIASFFLVLISLVLITACGENLAEKGKKGVGRYGMLDDGTPQYTAVRFMQSLYEDENIDNVLALSTERMGRIIKRYHTNRNVQRHVVNLMFDEVEVSPESSDSVGRAEFAQKATVILFLSGRYQEDKVDDIRTLKLVKEDGDWRVDDVLPDRYL